MIKQFYGKLTSINKQETKKQSKVIVLSHRSFLEHGISDSQRFPFVSLSMIGHRGDLWIPCGLNTF